MNKSMERVTRGELAQSVKEEQEQEQAGAISSSRSSVECCSSAAQDLRLHLEPASTTITAATTTDDPQPPAPPGQQSEHPQTPNPSSSRRHSSASLNIIERPLHRLVRLFSSFKSSTSSSTKMFDCIPCLGSPGAQYQDENSQSNRTVEAQLKEWRKKESVVIPLLLLGAGESGKTTIIKQMKIIHIDGFTEEERIEKRTEIRENIFEAIKDLTTNLAYLKPPIELEDASNRPSLEFIQELDMTQKESYDYPQEFYDHVKNLWSDGGIQRCYLRANEFSLIDSTKYFLDKIDEVRCDDFMPSNQDILQSRRRTCEIQKIEFQAKIPVQYGGGHQPFWMFDVGGQKGERRKWIQVFSGITAILYVVDCSSFDTNLREDNTKNRLAESLELFEDLWFSKYLNDSGFILFLNKQDTLKEKVERGTTKIVDYFPEYSDYKPQGRDAKVKDEYERVRCFIRDKFVEISKQKGHTNGLTPPEDMKRRSKLFTHFTTATDTGNISRVFNDVHTMLILFNINGVV